MPRSPVFARVTLTAIVGLAACAPVEPHAMVQPPSPVTRIEVTVNGCATDRIEIAVRPWEAHIRRGTEIRWTTPPDVDSMVLEPKNDWPFPAPPPVGRPGQDLPAGRVLATAPIGHRYSYRILVHCGGRVIDIDPDLIIRDPMGGG